MSHEFVVRGDIANAESAGHQKYVWPEIWIVNRPARMDTGPACSRHRAGGLRDDLDAVRLTI